MASSALTPGELYFIGERDPRTGFDTPYVKIGIVRESEGRTSEFRVKEHQTGNPRELYLVAVIASPVVEQIETLLHGVYAPSRLSGEWFYFSETEREAAINAASEFVSKARLAEPLIEIAEELKLRTSNGTEIHPTHEVRTAHRRLVSLRLEMKVYDELMGEIAESIRTLHDRGISLGRYATMSEQKEAEKFDEKRFQAEHPDLWIQYAEEATSWSQRFRIIEPKELKQELSIEASQLSPRLQGVRAAIDKAKESADLAGLHHHYLELLSELSPREWEEKTIEAYLKMSCRDYEGIIGVCAWPRAEQKTTKLDKKALRESHPAVFDNYVSKGINKARLNIARDRGFQHV